MHYDKDKLDKENREILERNIEQSEALIEENKREASTRGDSEPGINRAPKDDPQHSDPHVPPGQENVPAGGTTGGHIRRGSGS